MTFPEVTSVWGVSAVAILDSSVNCECVWSTKKLIMPVYCVAANCNNSQTTPGITMHKLPRNRPAVRRKWIKFIQFKRADFLAAPHHAHLCGEHFSECDFANPMEYCMRFASKLTRRSSTLSKSSLTGYIETIKLYCNYSFVCWCCMTLSSPVFMYTFPVSMYVKLLTVFISMYAFCLSLFSHRVGAL